MTFSECLMLALADMPRLLLQDRYWVESGHCYAVVEGNSVDATIHILSTPH
jgi:hypothetical protein